MTVYTAHAGEGDGRTTVHPTARDAWRALERRREALEVLHGTGCDDYGCIYGHAADLSEEWFALETLHQNLDDDGTRNEYALANDGTGSLELARVGHDDDAPLAVYTVAVAGPSSQAGLATIAAGAAL